MIPTHRFCRRMTSAASGAAATAAATAAWMILLTVSSVVLLSSHAGIVAHAASASVRVRGTDDAADNSTHSYRSKMCRDNFLKDRETSAPLARRVAAENEAVEGTWREWDVGRRGGDGGAMVRKTTVPCDESTGLAGDLYPCRLVDLESHVPLSDLQPSGTNEDGSDGWGWTSPTSGREYALVTLEGRTTFVDVSDRANPLVVGWLPSHNDQISWWLDVKTYANHAYVVEDYDKDRADDTGMQVFDLTQLDDVTTGEIPKTFSETIHYSEFSTSHNIFINEDSGYAYVVGADGGEDCDGGLHVIDLSDPSNPVFEACYSEDGYTHDVQCVNYDFGPDSNYIGQEICFACNEDTVTIIDVTDKNNMVQLSKVGYDEHHYTHQGWLTEDRRYFIFGDEVDEMEIDEQIGTRTFVLDVTNLTNPEIVRTLTSVTSNAIDHNQYVLGSFTYQANYRAGLRVLDVSNIGSGPADDAPDEVGYFDLYPPDNDSSFNGAWSVYPYFNNTVLMFGIEQGLMVLTPHCSIYGDGSCSAAETPTREPTASPTPEDDDDDASPSGEPSASPSGEPSASPSGEPSASPSFLPTTTPAPVQQPTGNQTITTTFDGDVEEAGNMFDVVAEGKDVHVLGFDVHTGATGDVNAEVYTRAGSWRGHHDDDGDWTPIMQTKVTGNGVGVATPLGDLDSPVTIPAGERRAFYVTLKDGNKLLYTVASERVGTTYVENSDLRIKVGCAKAYPLGAAMYQPRSWEGILRYSLTDSGKVNEEQPTAPLYQHQDGSRPTPEGIKLRERSRQHVDLDAGV